MALQKPRVFVLGNPLMPQDSIALRAAERLQKRFPKIEFAVIASIDSLQEIPKELTVMDAVKGIKKVELLIGLKRLAGSNAFSLHDLDSGFQLKLFKKLGKIKKIKIIAIPMEMELREAVESAEEVLKTIFAP